MTRTEETKL